MSRRKSEKACAGVNVDMFNVGPDTLAMRIRSDDAWLPSPRLA